MAGLKKIFNMNTKLCSNCDTIIQMLNTTPRVKEENEDLCDRCYHRNLTLNMFLDEYEELLETLRQGEEW